MEAGRGFLSRLDITRLIDSCGMKMLCMSDGCNARGVRAVGSNKTNSHKANSQTLYRKRHFCA